MELVCATCKRNLGHLIINPSVFPSNEEAEKLVVGTCGPDCYEKYVEKAQEAYLFHFRFNPRRFRS
jgi:hypothetical protein